jgi:hypothetical protein
MSEWQMVPVEPTLDMLHAAVEHQNAHADEPGWAGLYNAMIAAAPPAPTAEPSEPTVPATSVEWLLAQCEEYQRRAHEAEHEVLALRAAKEQTR